LTRSVPRLAVNILFTCNVSTVGKFSANLNYTVNKQKCLKFNY